MKEIQTKAGKILISEFGKKYVNELPPEVDTTKTYIVLGKLSELTDKDCEEFIKTSNQWVYFDYTKQSKFNMLGSAKESFISLLESESIDTSKEYLIIKVL